MGPGRFESNVALDALNTLGVGGRARWFVRVTEPSGVGEAHRWCEARKLPLLVLGGGSNVVVADEGWPGLVMRVELAGLEIREADGGAIVRAAAGEVWDRVVSDSVDRGLAGIECLSGIPGSVGGTPIQNVGAYGQEVSDVIETVGVYDRHSGSMQTLSSAECRFSYRTSRFKREDAERFIVCDVTFRLRAGDATIVYPDLQAQLERDAVTSPAVQDVRRAVLAVRRAKGMVLNGSDPDTRSVGSFFMNPVLSRAEVERLAHVTGEHVPGYGMSDGRLKVPAAWLIERAGFRKGYSEGRAGISTKHPLAVINRGGATAREIVDLAVRVKRAVHDRCAVSIQAEPVFVGFSSDPGVEYLRTPA